MDNQNLEQLEDAVPQIPTTKRTRKLEVQLKTLFDLVQADYKENRYKESILNANLKHLEPHFAERSAERVKPWDIEEYKTLREKEGAAKTTICRQFSARGRFRGQNLKRSQAC